MARDYQTKSNSSGLPDSITATRFGGGEFNSIATELENAVTTSNQTLAPADGTGEVSTQLAMALAIYGAGGAFYHADTGAVNAYVLTPISPKESPPTYFDGFTVIFEAGTVNTTASTVNVNSLGVKDITYSDGNALVGGELAGSCGIKYNLSDDRFELLFSSGALAGLSQVYVIDASQADQGAASTNANTYTVFDAAAAIGTSKNATIYFPHNPVAGNQTLFTFDTSLDLTSYPNLLYKMDQGVQFDRTTGDEIFTVYSPGNVTANPRQIISLSELLQFAEPGTISANWYDVEPSNSAAVNSANFANLLNVISVSDEGGYNVIFPAGDYSFTTISLLKSNSELSNISFIGSGGEAGDGTTRFFFTPSVANSTGFLIKSCQMCSFDRIEFIGNSANLDYVIQTHAFDDPVLSTYNTSFKNCSFRMSSAVDVGEAVVHLKNSAHTSFDDCHWTGDDPSLRLGENQGVDSGTFGNGSIGNTNFQNCYITGDIFVRNSVGTIFFNSEFGRKSDTLEPVQITPEGDERQINTTIIGCQNVSVNEALSGVFWTQGSAGNGLVFMSNRLKAYVTNIHFDSGDGNALISANVFQTAYDSTPTAVPGQIPIIIDTGENINITGNDFSDIIANSFNPIDDNRTLPQAPVVVSLSLGSDHTFASVGNFEDIITQSSVELRGGLYYVIYHASIAVNAAGAGLYTSRVLINGSTVTGSSDIKTLVNSEVASLSGSFYFFHDATVAGVDIDLAIRQSTGTASDVKATDASYSTTLQIKEVH